MSLTDYEKLRRDETVEGEWLEDKGQFTRFTTQPEESVWYCRLCESTNVDVDENVCHNCGEEDED